MKGTLITAQSKRKLSVVGIIALFACVIAIALIFLIQTCGFSNGTFYFRHSDNGMYDDATAITAQAAKSSHGFLSFTADSEKACAGTIECSVSEDETTWPQSIALSRTKPLPSLSTSPVREVMQKSCSTK